MIAALVGVALLVSLLAYDSYAATETGVATYVEHVGPTGPTIQKLGSDFEYTLSWTSGANVTVELWAAECAGNSNAGCPWVDEAAGTGTSGTVSFGDGGNSDKEFLILTLATTTVYLTADWSGA